MANTFGTILRRERKRAGMTMGQLARALDVSVTYLSDVERDERPPLSAIRIAAASRAMKLDNETEERLRLAAARHQNKIELPLPDSDKGREVGAALMRGWDEFDDDDWAQLLIVASRKKPKAGD